jgi:glycosyltransferase involved in cell wall biosynthesis
MHAGPATEGAGATRDVVALFANTDWYLWNFRRSLALALRAAGFDVLLLSPPGEHGERLRALGLRWEPVPMRRRSLAPWREAAFVLGLARLLRRERVALLHSFTLKCAVHGGLAARLAGVPARVAAVAGLGYVFTNPHWRARLLRAPVRALLRPALGGANARLVLQNDDDVALFEQAGLVAKDAIRLIPGSGVDLQRFRRTGREVFAATPHRYLLASRLLGDKGVPEFIEAARRLGGSRGDRRFLVAGTPDPGNPTAIAEAQVRAWHDEGVIEWLGHVDDMASLLGEVDAVVLPSHREGLPKSLIEAAARALPLVATDVPGCRDVVRDGVEGLRVPVRDPLALADAMARLAADPVAARRYGDAARRRAEAEYDERRVLERTLAVYAEVWPQGFAAVAPDAREPATPAARVA